MRVVVSMLIVLTLMLTGCFLGMENSLEAHMENISGLDMTSAVKGEYIDTHGGFHGDGATFAAYSLPDAELGDAWIALPLPEEFDSFLRSGFFDGEDGVPLLPAVENGSYIFVDRHSESGGSSDPVSALARYSLNFTLIIYDSDAEMLYYMELDT